VLYSTESVVRGWETVSFWFNYRCCTIQRVLLVAGKLLAFQEKIRSMEFDFCLFKNTLPYEGAECHTQTQKHTDCRNKILSKAVKFTLMFNKFRGKFGNWTEHIRQLEEDILKVAVHFSVQEDETEKWKLRVVGEGMGRMDCGLRRNGTRGLWCEKEWDRFTLVLEGMGKRNCVVRRNWTDC
jgi:hypothetical protein